MVRGQHEIVESTEHQGFVGLTGPTFHESPWRGRQGFGTAGPGSNSVTTLLQSDMNTLEHVSRDGKASCQAALA